MVEMLRKRCRLASVVSGAIDQRNVAPASVFSIEVPYGDRLLGGPYGEGGITYDPTTNRLYIMRLFNQDYGKRGLVSVFQVS
jgi:hypothetical protein